MQDIILTLLATKFTGVRKDGLETLARALALQVGTEEEAKFAVEKCDREKVDAFVKAHRASVDKEVTDGVNTYKRKSQKELTGEKREELQADAMPTPAGDNVSNNNSALDNQVAMLLEKALKPYQEKLERLEVEALHKGRLESLHKTLETCQDKAFSARVLKDYSRMRFESEDAFSEYLKETEGDITASNQAFANAALGTTGRPMFGTKNEDGISSSVAQYIAAKQGDVKDAFSGKEL